MFIARGCRFEGGLFILRREESESVEVLSPISEQPVLVANEVVAEAGMDSSSLGSSDMSNRSWIQDPCELSEAFRDRDDRANSGLAGSDERTADNGGDSGAST